MKKILIVEDDFVLSMINQKHLELMGHEIVDSVVSGEAAIEAVKKHNPEVILMDMRLEGSMSGVEAMIEISKFSNAYVIYLTGNSEEEFKNLTKKTNMLAFCVKPVHFEELKSILSKIE